jgi:hypothetical protein
MPRDDSAAWRAFLHSRCVPMVDTTTARARRPRHGRCQHQGMNPHVTPVFVSMLCIGACAAAPATGRPIADRERAPLATSFDAQPPAAGADAQRRCAQPRRSMGVRRRGRRQQQQRFRRRRCAGRRLVGLLLQRRRRAVGASERCLWRRGPSSPEGLELRQPRGTRPAHSAGQVQCRTSAPTSATSTATRSPIDGGRPGDRCEDLPAERRVPAIGAEYEFFFDKGDSLEDAFDDGQFLYLLGMGLRL